ncbi:hypothetical protein TNCV_350721 [Trichonephila clavipes]|nr:hypothetical protein TNCV_350721 [Trichonephila clavipes]
MSWSLVPAEDPPCREQYTKNLSKVKRHSVGVVKKLGEWGASSGVVLVTWPSFNLLNYTRALDDGPRNFEPWSSDVDDT